MASLINAVDSDISSYIGEATITMLVGMGYYLMNRVSKEEKKEKITNEETTLVDNLSSLHSLIKENSTKSPTVLLSQMIQNKLSPTIDTYNLLIYNSYKNGFYSEGEKLKEEIFESTSPISPNVQTFNILLKCLQIKLGKNIEQFDQEVNKLRNEFTNKGIKYNVESENILMDIYSDQNRFEKALIHFEDSHRNLDFDIYTYTTVLKTIKCILSDFHYNNKTRDLTSFKSNKRSNDKDYYIVYSQKISYIKSIVEKQISNKKCTLRQLGSSIDVESYISSLIDAYIALKENEKAKQVFYDFSPKEESSFISIIKLYTHEKNIMKCFEVFSSFKSLLVLKKPSISVYGTILNSCAKLGNMKLAEEILNEMFKNSIYPNSYVYSTLINGYKLSGRLDCAIQAYKLAEIDIGNLTVAVVNTILNTCAEYSDFHMLNEIYERAINKHKINPDKITFSILIKCYSKNNEFDKLWDLYKFLLANKFYDEITFNTLLDVLANAEHEKNLYEIYSEMKKNKINVSIVTYGVLLKLYVNLANKERSEEIFREILRKNITPSIIIFQLMIKLYSYLGLLDNVWKVYKSITTYNLIPDQQLYESLLRINLKHNYLNEVFIIIKDAIYNDVPIEMYLIDSFFMKINSSENLNKKKKMDFCNEISNLYYERKMSLSKKCYTTMDEIFGNKHYKENQKVENKFDLNIENVSAYSKHRYSTLKTFYKEPKIGKSIYDM